MTKIDLKNLTIKKAHDDMKSGKYTAVELAQEYLNNIKEKNKDFNVYLEVYDDVLEYAKSADAMFKENKATLLTGIPIAIKDNILIKGKIASAASKILEKYKAAYNSTVIEKLKDEGAVFLGRVNMDEFAMGGSTENSAFGVTKNPLDITRVPGGSSGGSAAAVAANMALAALGSDTGGSIRQPASFCGVVGLKPTYGSVSRYGLIAMGSSLDQIGPIAKTAEDAKIIFNAIKGKDEKDSTSSDLRSTTPQDKSENIKMTIGVPEDFLKMEGIDKDVLENFRETLQKLEDKGHKIKKVSLHHLKYSLASYYIIMPAESSTNLARFDGVRYGTKEEGDNLLGDYMKTRGMGFGREVRRRIVLGAYVLSSGYYDAYYNKATQVRDKIKEDFTKAFEGVDVIVTPTTPTPAFEIGQNVEEPLSMYLADIFTVSANLSGVPAISIPSGKTEGEKKLPFGFQAIAPNFREDILFALGGEVEKI